jgi:hypothetical protein
VGLPGFFLVPGVEGLLAITGALHARYHFQAAPEKVDLHIIQVTTVGFEPDLVRRTIATIHGYRLSFANQVWVVNEPGQDNEYPEADRVITVPSEFRCKPIQKARALECSRRLRQELGLNRVDVKITLLDDDFLPSKRYLELAHDGDYDLCQGATVANREFGHHGFRHFVLSHFDDIRVRNCMIYCSFTQGITNKPLFVHGEGLTFTGLVEDVVTWDHPIIASDDLVFGTRAANARFRWGYSNAAIQIISPLDLRGCLEAAEAGDVGQHDRHLQPGDPSVVGGHPQRAEVPAGMRVHRRVDHECHPAHHRCHPDPHRGALRLLGLARPVIVSYWVAAWINASGHPNRDRYYDIPLSERTGPMWWRRRQAGIRYFLWRLSQAAAGGTFMLPFTATLPAFIIIGSILTGKPRSFVVIRQSDPAPNP